MARETRSPKAHPGELRMRWDIVFDTLRRFVQRAGTVLGGLGAFLVAGMLIAVGATLLFGQFAEHVMSGGTQAFDEAVLKWMVANHSPLMDAAALEITALGTGVVVLTMVGVASLFLSLTRHKYSALLLLVATGGGLLLNTALKQFFDRPRPDVFEWGMKAVSSSFPSGHAMSATIVYSTVAYLAARLYNRVWPRWVTMIVALLIITLICASRMYLGVHYPSDVLAGAIIGLGWAAFCMATLEAIQRFSQRSRPEIKKDEQPAPEVQKV
ncbi:MAG TPA: phosphatase PAP2 family protein [Gemmatimonadaceae bacterium]|nr:phosphatase PAP2 family protein [Gemmatimonadaceae bacterium]